MDNNTKLQKQREIDMAWAQHKGTVTQTPTEQEIWEQMERKSQQS
jgi:hypothetical protein